MFNDTSYPSYPLWDLYQIILLNRTCEHTRGGIPRPAEAGQGAEGRVLKELDIVASAGRISTVREMEEDERDDGDEEVIHDGYGWDNVISVLCTSTSSSSSSSRVRGLRDISLGRVICLPWI